jgi:hypothetical protein
MITNQRIYHFHPQKIDAGMAMLAELHEKTIQTTGRDFRVMTSRFGPVSTIVFDMRFQNDEDLHTFSSLWYPMLFEEKIIERWFANVKQMASGMWGLPGIKEDSNAKVDGYWGRLTQRLVYQPYASSYNPANEAGKRIVEKTAEVFQKEVVLSQCYQGASNKIALELDFETVEQQSAFYDTWLACLKETKLLEAFLENIQEGSSELWETV